MSGAGIAQDPATFHRVWRVLDELSDISNADVAYRQALQLVYMRCRAQAGWAQIVDRRSGSAGDVLARVWPRTRVAQTYGIASSHRSRVQQVGAHADGVLDRLAAEIERLDSAAGLFALGIDRYSALDAKGGNYFTSCHLADLFAGLGHPRVGETVRDPVCGSGRLLCAAAQRVPAHDGSPLDLYGSDIRPEARWVAAMNLAFHHLPADLGDGPVDSLRAGPGRRPADLVLANPPVNMKGWGRSELRDDPRWSLGLPPSSNGNFAWVQHILADLTANGRAVVLLASSAVHNTNSDDARIRQALVEQGLVAGIVELPNWLFPHTRSGTALWLLAKGPRPHPGEILFADARRLGTRREPAGRMFVDEDLDRLIRVFAVWRGLQPGGRDDDPETTPGVSAVPVGQLAAEDYDLTPTHYTQPRRTAPITVDGRRSRKEILYERFDHTAEATQRLRSALEARS
ncbi:class I SAM-dependent DNA methyltransferase [Streptomyces mirabilis]|uniref:HsdM family class I SAM-dependent methyltransferase n=1 Tax=Streptomyces mirabilis TaxID=68239 RepID=UPI000AACFD5B